VKRKCDVKVNNIELRLYLKVDTRAGGNHFPVHPSTDTIFDDCYTDLILAFLVQRKNNNNDTHVNSSILWKSD